MNYTLIYNRLMERARTRSIEGYTEKHHVVPRCMGGSDDKFNLVRLTPEEHYLAHQLLVKMYPDNYSLVRAAIMMMPKRPTNKLYGWLRRRFAEAQRIGQAGEFNSQYGTKWVTNGEKNRKVPKSQLPEEGWSEGRKSRIIRKRKKKQIDQEKAKRREEKKKQKVEELKILHEIYVKEGFEGVLRTGYSKSKQNLVMRFSEYLPEFVPQNGKRRGF